MCVVGAVEGGADPLDDRVDFADRIVLAHAAHIEHGGCGFDLCAVGATRIDDDLRLSLCLDEVVGAQCELCFLKADLGAICTLDHVLDLGAQRPEPVVLLIAEDGARGRVLQREEHCTGPDQLSVNDQLGGAIEHLVGLVLLGDAFELDTGEHGAAGQSREGDGGEKEGTNRSVGCG